MIFRKLVFSTYSISLFCHLFHLLLVISYRICNRLIGFSLSGLWIRGLLSFLVSFTTRRNCRFRKCLLVGVELDFATNFGRLCRVILERGFLGNSLYLLRNLWISCNAIHRCWWAINFRFMCWLFIEGWWFFICDRLLCSICCSYLRLGQIWLSLCCRRLRGVWGLGKGMIFCWSRRGSSDRWFFRWFRYRCWEVLFLGILYRRAFGWSCVFSYLLIEKEHNDGLSSRLSFIFLCCRVHHPRRSWNIDQFRKDSWWFRECSRYWRCYLWFQGRVVMPDRYFIYFWSIWQLL